MKKTLLRTALIIIMMISAASVELSSQTPGTFSFSTNTTAPSGSYGLKHYLAIWIENSSGTFIKTKIRYTNPDDLDHMQTWVTKSGQNIVDATTGATLNSYGTITFLWNGTNVAGTLVPDGSYFVWLEMAWSASLSTGKTVNSFPFTKGSQLFHSTPGNTANFLSVVIDWTPLSTGIEGTLESKDVNIYPNPSSGLVNIDFKRTGNECLFQVVNESGAIVYNEKLSGLSAGIRTFDLSALPAGLYYGSLKYPEREIVFPLILTK